MKNLMIVLAALSATSAFAAAESLKGVTTDRDGVTIQVVSGGCTSKKSFKINLLETSPVQVKFVRVGNDFCEAYLPYGVKLAYSYDELGLSDDSQFVIANPVRADGFVAR